MALLGTGRSAGRHEALAMSDAYAVSADIRALRERAASACSAARSASPTPRSGRSTALSAPMWNFVYDSTVRDLPAGARRVRDLGAGGAANRAGDRAAPRPGADAGHGPRRRCSDASTWVAHGFEIVQSVYPGWKLTGAEVRGGLRPARRRWSSARGTRWAPTARAGPSGSPASRSRFGGTASAVAEGKGSNVLGGPVRALRLPGRGDRPLPGQRPARGRRDRHHGDADRRPAGGGRRDLVDRARGNTDRRHRPDAALAGPPPRAAEPRARRGRAPAGGLRCSPRSRRFSSARCLPRLCTASARAAAMRAASAARCRGRRPHALVGPGLPQGLLRQRQRRMPPA